MIRYVQFLLFGLTTLCGFEVNTHQALTRCAITDSCGNGKAENLRSFVTHANLNTLAPVYQNNIFESYGKTYKNYVEKPTSSHFDDWNISINPNYLGMIEAGCVLEDAVYPVYDHVGDGRFNNHLSDYELQIKQRGV